MKRSFVRTLAGVLLGLLAGGLLDSLLMSFPYMPGMMLTGLIVIPTLIASLLGTWAGWPALIAVTISYLSAAVVWGGSAGGVIAAEAILLPTWGIQLILRKRPRFYQGVAQSACLQFGALTALVVGGWMVVKQDLITVMLNYLRVMLDRQPETPLMLSTLGQLGLFGSDTGLDFSRALTQAQQAQLLDELYMYYKGDLQESLAQIVLYAGLLGGALSYWLCARILAHRGVEPAVSYAHPRDWFLPAHLIVGPPICMLGCYLAWQAGIQGADAACFAMEGLCILALSVQGLGTVDRTMFKRGVTPGMRKFVLIIFVFAAQLALPFIGAASGLLGSKGILSSWLRKRMDQHKGGDGE